MNMYHNSDNMGNETNLSEIEIKKRVWRGMTNSEKHAMYYSKQAHSWRIQEIVITISILLSSVASAILLLVKIFNNISVGLFFLVALLTILNYVIGFSKNAATSLLIKNQCRDICYQWEKLWMEQRDIYFVMKIADELEHRLELITSGEHLVNNSLNYEMSKEADRVVTSRMTPNSSS